MGRQDLWQKTQCVQAHGCEQVLQGPQLRKKQEVMAKGYGKPCTAKVKAKTMKPKRPKAKK